MCPPGLPVAFNVCFCLSSFYQSWLSVGFTTKILETTLKLGRMYAHAIATVATFSTRKQSRELHSHGVQNANGNRSRVQPSTICDELRHRLRLAGKKGCIFTTQLRDLRRRVRWITKVTRTHSEHAHLSRSRVCAESLPLFSRNRTGHFEKLSKFDQEMQRLMAPAIEKEEEDERI